MAYLLGIDVSTTGAKALLIDERGQVAASAVSEYPLLTPRPLWSEQDPTDWWKGVCRSIQQVLADAGIDGSHVSGVGLTGQMHGLVLLDKRGKVLRPAILWNDQRTGLQCKWITQRVSLQRLLEWTGNPALPGFTAPKILWVRDHEPEIYARADQILLPKDYIRYKLTDLYATDMAGASGTLLFDVKARGWSEEMLEALLIPAEWLPPCHEGTQLTGTISEAAAAATGLETGIPVVGGGGDQAAQAVGVGAVSPGIVALTLGTSGVIFAPTGEPFIEAEGRLHSFCHAVPGRWHLMGVMLSAAGALRWYHDALSPESSYEELLAPAADTPPGAEGLLFLPYLTGERTPYPDPMARGAFIGLTVRHTMAHLTRAVLEGVAFGLRDSLELLREAGLGSITQVRVSGGGVKSPLWRQILADVLDCKLVTVKTTEGAAYGAALLAGVGAGLWPDVETACATTVKVADSIQPDSENAASYQQIYELYHSLYGTLRPAFRTLTEFEMV